MRPTTRRPFIPLLFVVRMEYLFRISMLACDNQQFSFHARCWGLKLNHLCFADDHIILLCNGEANTAKIMCESLNIFLAAYGLHANSSKSALYMAGIPNPIQLQISHSLGFPLGKLPFTYLGVPLTSKCISGVDCDILFDIMTTKIHTWSSMFLSYAGCS